jgi:hypothetical protein
MHVCIQIRVWNGMTGQQILPNIQDHSGPIRSITSIPGLNLPIIHYLHYSSYHIHSFICLLFIYARNRWIRYQFQ